MQTGILSLNRKKLILEIKMSEWLGDPVTMAMIRKEITITNFKEDVKTITDFLCTASEDIHTQWMEINNSTSIKTKFIFERYHQRQCIITYPIQQQYKDACTKLNELKQLRADKRVRWDELNRKDDLSYKNWGNDVVINNRTKPEEKEFRQLGKITDSLTYQIRGLQQKISQLQAAMLEEIQK